MTHSLRLLEASVTLNVFMKAKQRRSRERSDAGRDGYSLGGCGDAVGQANIPPSLALVHTQKDAGGTGRMIGGCVEQEKIWPQLRGIECPLNMRLILTSAE